MQATKMFSNADFGSIDYDQLSFKHSISSKDFKKVYKPNDDSYQMLYSLILSHKNHFFDSIFTRDSLKILELGVGSGFVIGNFVNYIRQANPAQHVQGIALDLNDDACRAAKRFFDRNKLTEVIDVVNSDGLSGIDASGVGRPF